MRLRDMSVGVSSFLAGAAPVRSAAEGTNSNATHDFLPRFAAGLAEHSRAPLSPRPCTLATLMLLGSGELGREFAIAAKRLGCRIIACDRYANAPAMQVADAFEVFPMLDGKALRAAVEKHKPDVIVPEIEAIDTATLAELEARGLAGRALRQGRAADHEPRRHPRLRRARARPRHLAISLRREPRGGHRGGRRGRAARAWSSR